MSFYSPQAEALLGKWQELSMNMQQAILRAQALQRQADKLGEAAQLALQAQLAARRVNEQYREIGEAMRALLRTEGVSREPPDDASEPGLPVHYVDFRISEEAIPELDSKLEQLREPMMHLVLSLFAIHIN